MALPVVYAAIILDSDGNRLCAKYYARNLKTSHAQKDFETQLYSRTKNTNARKEAEVVMLNDVIVVYRSVGDSFIFMVGPSHGNELVLSAVLDGLHDALS